MGVHTDPPTGGWRDEKFRAEPARMIEYGRKFQELGDDVDRARTYAATWVDFDPSGCAAFERLAQWTITVDSGIQDLLADMHAAVRGSGDEIVRSGGSYLTTDQDASALLDRTYWEH